MAKKKIAWFTNGTQQEQFSKSAHASECLLPFLSDRFEIDLFCEQANIKLGGLVSKNFLTANILNKHNPYDYYFYNFENKKYSNFIRIHLGLQPGIVWFHDFNLLDDGPEPILNSPWNRMIELAKDPANDSLWPEFDDLFIPVKPAAIRESSISFFRLFSNERDFEQFRALSINSLSESVNSALLPMPIAITEPDFICSEPKETRITRTVAICSKPSVDSHIHSILMALKSEPDYKLLWLIESQDKLKCQQLISEFDLKNFELIEGKTIKNWIKILERSTCCLHFLHSFYDQLQPWLACSLAAAKPVVVLEFGEADYIPDQVVLKIECGSREVSSVRAFLKAIADSEDLNILAKEYAFEKLSAASLAAELEIYLNQAESKYKQMQSVWSRLQVAAKDKLIAQSLKPVETELHTHFLRHYQELGWL